MCCWSLCCSALHVVVIWMLMFWQVQSSDLWHGESLIAQNFEDQNGKLVFQPLEAVKHCRTQWFHLVNGFAFSKAFSQTLCFPFQLKCPSVLHLELPRSCSYRVYRPPQYSCVPQTCMQFFFFTSFISHTSVGYTGLSGGDSTGPMSILPRTSPKRPSVLADLEVLTFSLTRTG